MDNTAEKKIETIITKWFLNDPIMLGIMCLVERQEDENQKTIGIDTRTSPPTIKYNPKFINALSIDQLELVMASEGFKLLLRHCTTRFKNPKVVSNLASQITVNECLFKNNRLPNDFNAPLPETYELEAGKYYEEYYRKLLDDFEDMMSKVKIQFGPPPPNAEPESGGFKEYKDDKEAMKEYQNPQSTSNQYWAENDLFDAEVQNMVDEKKNSMKNWGKFTGNVMDEIVAANQPKISWKEIVRRFKNSVMTTKQNFTRMKVNRRYDLAQPGKRRTYKSKIIFAVDCSGSMDDDDLKEGFAVINDVCKHSDIEYILFDTEIKIIEKKIKRARNKFKVSGRGGTDFNDIMNHAEKSKADGMVVFTDGFAGNPYKPKNTKILWLLTRKEYKRPEGCDWGIVCHLNRYEHK